MELYASVASTKLPNKDSFFSISLRNTTFSTVPENVYCDNSVRNTLKLNMLNLFWQDHWGNKLVELEIVEKVFPMTVQRALKKDEFEAYPSEYLKILPPAL